MISIKTVEGIQLDNDFHYFDSCRSAISHSDGSAQITFINHDGDIRCHIKPSDVQFKQDIIDSLLALNRMMGIKIIFSKSLKISSTISFSVSLSLKEQ